MNFYDKYVKRVLDIFVSLMTLVGFGWVYLIVAILVKKNLGSPILYTTERVGKNEKTFKLYKFRSMIDAKDENGNDLPDTERLTKFGRILRSTSLDEIPEFINILRGDMSLIGPRPLPTIYLPYYREKERSRHCVRPGLSGWAQVNGRNAMSWDSKFEHDVEYVNNISLIWDIKIIFLTIKKVLIREGIGQGEEAPTNLHEERSYMAK